mgnify:CR=1 FL=1
MGGNKRKKGKKQNQQEDRELQYKGESEEYAQVIKILGDGRFECNCADGVKRIAHVRGKMRKRIWIANGDIILVSLRDFEPEKCDVVEKYKEKEVAKLKKAGEIPDSMVLPSAEAEEKEVNDDYGDIVFEDQDDKNKKKNDDNDIPNDDEEEDEKEDKKENEEDKKDEDEDEEEQEKEEEKEKEREKQKMSKKEKKEKDKKIKKKRDDKKKEKDDDKEFNIDDI